ncbi:MAG: hypothetical protein WCL50_03375 [Spirochaetota bacterium]
MADKRRDQSTAAPSAARFIIVALVLLGSFAVLVAYGYSGTTWAKLGRYSAPQDLLLKKPALGAATKADYELILGLESSSATKQVEGMILKYRSSGPRTGTRSGGFPTAYAREYIISSILLY